MESLNEALNKLGLRSTRQREVVYSIVAEAKDLLGQLKNLLPESTFVARVELNFRGRLQDQSQSSAINPNKT